MPAEDIAIPETNSPAGRCEYCGRPFPTANRLVLHKGVEHAERLDTEETAAYRDARSAEEDELRLLLLKAIAALVLLYFSLLFTYAIVT